MFPAVLLNDVIFHVTKVVGVKHWIDPWNLAAHPWVQVLSSGANLKRGSIHGCAARLNAPLVCISASSWLICTTFGDVYQWPKIALVRNSGWRRPPYLICNFEHYLGRQRKYLHKIWFADRYKPYDRYWAQNHTFDKIPDGGGRHLGFVLAWAVIRSPVNALASDSVRREIWCRNDNIDRRRSVRIAV